MRRILLPMALGGALLALPGPAPAVVLDSGDIVVADGCGTAASGRLLRIDPDTGAQETIAVGGLLEHPVGVALEEDGALLASDSASGAGGTLLRIDPSDGSQTAVSGSFEGLWDVALEAAGTALVTDFGDGGVYRVDPDQGTPVALVPAGTFTEPQGIVIAPDGFVYVTEGGATPRVWRIDPVTGAPSVLTAGLSLPTGLGMSTTGRPVVVDALLAQVFRVEPNGTKTPLVPASNDLLFPFDVAVAPSGRIFVSDWGSPTEAAAILEIDPVTQAQTIVSEGGLLEEPCGIVVVPEPGALASLAVSLATVALLAGRRTRRAGAIAAA